MIISPHTSQYPSRIERREKFLESRLICPFFSDLSKMNWRDGKVIAKHNPCALMLYTTHEKIPIVYDHGHDDKPVLVGLKSSLLYIRTTRPSTHKLENKSPSPFYHHQYYTPTPTLTPTPPPPPPPSIINSTPSSLYISPTHLSLAFNHPLF